MSENKITCVSKANEKLARDVCRYLTENMGSRITIKMLSEVFGVSGTGIKCAFKAVYGEPIYRYIRRIKMQSAAEELKNTDKSVLLIAGSYGYDNGSKFAKAFKECMGAPPLSYRKNKV